jgi:hypothetical protein
MAEAAEPAAGAPSVPLPPVPPAPISTFAKAKKALTTLAVSGGLAASLFGVAADRIDPVAPSPAAISCSDPDHDLELTRETKESPAFELDRYAPVLAVKLNLPDLAATVDAACPQDRANVVSTVREMIAAGKFRPR